jgi:DNA-binding LacI/PurR family transcriptional regulator
MAPGDEDPRRAATLADVAALCGVAISTASRALSNPGRVKTATRMRIEAAASELGYVANAHALALTSGKTKAVAVLVSDVTNPFYFDLIRGTQRQLKAAGYFQVLVDTEESDELEDATLHTLRRSFDGAILAASRLSDRRLIALADEMPIVAINRQTRGVASVVIDTPNGIEQAVGHLYSLGHRRMGYVAGPETSWPNLNRWQAMQRACGEHGITPLRVGPFSPRKDSGAAAADAILNSSVTAAVAFNDLLAIGMLVRFRERGVRIPGDLSIVGCDDIFGADFCNPPLTTLTAPIERAGRLAVTMLLASLDRATALQPRRIANLPTHLTVRSSTGPVNDGAR